MKPLYSGRTVSLFVMFATIHGSTYGQAPASNEVGENAFAKNCAGCHVRQMVGHLHAPRLAQLRQLPAERVREALVNGRMRPNTMFMSKAEVEAVVAYLSAPAAAAAATPANQAPTATAPN